MSLTEKTDIRDSDEKVVEIEMERLRNFTNHTGWSRSRTADESTQQSGDGCFAYISGKNNESIGIEERIIAEMKIQDSKT